MGFHGESVSFYVQMTLIQKGCPKKNVPKLISWHYFPETNKIPCKFSSLPIKKKQGLKQPKRKAQKHIVFHSNIMFQVLLFCCQTSGFVIRGQGLCFFLP